MKNHRDTLTLAAALLVGTSLGVVAQGPPLLPPPPPPPPNVPGGPGFGPPVPVAPVGPDVAPPPPVPTPVAPGTAPAAPNGPAAGDVTLRYQFTPGQVLRYRVVLDTNGTVTSASGTGIPIKQHLEMALHQTVKSVRATDGAATLTTQVDTLTMTLNGQNIPLPEQAQQQMKQAVTTTMTPAGQIVDFKPPSGTGTIPGIGLNPMDLQSLRALPDGPVSTGAVWNSKFEAPTGALNAYSKYTLTGFTYNNNDTVAAIGQKIYAEIKSGKATTKGSMGAKVTGLVTGTGTEQFDVNAGAINSQTNALQVKMTIIPPSAGARPATGVKANFQINSTLTRIGDTGMATPTPNTAVPATVKPSTPSDEPPTGQLQ